MLLASNISRPYRIALIVVLTGAVAIIVSLSVVFTTRRRSTQSAPLPASSTTKQPPPRRSSDRKRSPDVPEKAGIVTQSDYTFDVNKNMVYCAKRTVSVPLTTHVKDYSGILDSVAKQLANDGGGTVQLQKGVYMISRQFVLPSFVCVRGAGMNRTVLRMVANSAPFAKSGVIRIERARRVSLFNFTVDGNRDAQRNATEEERYGRYGFYSTETSHVWLDGIKVMNNLKYGFDPHGKQDIWGKYLVIDNCCAENNGLDGFTLDQTLHISLLNSVAIGNGRHGVNVVTGSRNVVIKNNNFVNNGEASKVGCGIVLQNNKELSTSYATISYNQVRNSPRAGICLDDVHNVNISHVTIHIDTYPRTVCIFLARVKKVSISNTTCNVTSGRRLKTDSTSKFTDDTKQPKYQSNANTPDPTCKHGLQKGNVCCSQDCNFCGGVACSRQGLPGDLCCTSQVRNSGRRCNDTSAPCVLGR